MLIRPEQLLHVHLCLQPLLVHVVDLMHSPLAVAASELRAIFSMVPLVVVAQQVEGVHRVEGLARHLGLKWT